MPIVRDARPPNGQTIGRMDGASVTSICLSDAQRLHYEPLGHEEGVIFRLQQTYAVSQLMISARIYAALG